MGGIKERHRGIIMKVDLNKVAREVINLSKENPDHVYNSPYACYYTWPNGGCILGQALIKAYPKIKDLLQLADLRSQFTFTALCKDFKIDLEGDDHLINYLEEVQRYQDEGMPWSVAVTKSQLEEVL